MRRLNGSGGVRARQAVLAVRRPFTRALVEGGFIGGLLASVLVGVLLIGKAAQDAERLEEEVGPEVLGGFVLGAVMGFVPGAFVGMLLALACLLLLVIATWLVGGGPARWWAIGSVLTALAVLASVPIVDGGASAWPVLLLVWATAVISFVRMRAVARGPRTLAVDEATAARLDRAFGEPPTTEPPPAR